MYQLKIFDFCNISTGNVKKLVPNVSDKRKYVLHNENLNLYLRLGLKSKILAEIEKHRTNE